MPFFARGAAQRKKCSYLHRLPSELAFGIPPKIAGRDKTADYKDDMSGVGLLVPHQQNFVCERYPCFWRHRQHFDSTFPEFGAIDKIKVLHGKGSAFVSFRLEAEAQFAKEAMDAQSLDGSEVLSALG